MSPMPASSPGVARETDAVGKPTGSEPIGSDPAVSPATDTTLAGQPLTQLDGSMEYLEHLEDGADYTATGGEHVLRRRLLDHEEYHAFVQNQIRDSDTLEAADGAWFTPGHGLVVTLGVGGTTLGMGGYVSERVMASIARLRIHEVLVVISTSRGTAATMLVACHLRLSTGRVVCANSTTTLWLDPDAPGGYEVVDSRTFDPRAVIETLHIVVPVGILAVEGSGISFKVSRLFPGSELIEGQRVVTFDGPVSRPVTRVTLRAPDMPVDRFSQVMADSGPHSVKYAIGWTAWLDIAPEDVTKASVLGALAARLGTSSTHVLAVGDDSNDVEVIEWAGVGVVMGSAPQWVRDRGDVLTGSVWRGGCAAILDALIERIGYP